MKTILAVTILVLLQTTAALAALPDFRSFAVFKASYSETGSAVSGGLAGTAFFISRQRALSAEHVLAPNLFRPNPGDKKVQVWLMNESGGVVEIFESQVRRYSGTDLAEIRFPSNVVAKDFVFSMATSAPVLSQATSSEGYQAGTADARLQWVGDRLQIAQVLAQVQHRNGGQILRKAKVELNASDVKLVDADCFHVSAPSIVGMSGGPTLADGKVIGVNSFGYPVGAMKKDSTWVVSLAALPKIPSP
jgi:hypothetical protein